MEKAERIPVHSSVYRNRIIGKTVYLLQRDLVAIINTLNRAAAACAVIKCQYILIRHESLLICRKMPPQFMRQASFGTLWLLMYYLIVL